jgi:5'-methylthioadenosine phosphorylase
MTVKIGVIGGSGLYDIEGLEAVENRAVDTPFGKPSDEYTCGRIGDREVFFLPRHGRGHVLLPSEIPHRANIMGFKMLGAERVLSISAVGSLKEELRPRDVCLPDQYFDRTKSRDEHTFFGNGLIAHVGFGEPCCPELRAAMAKLIPAVAADSIGPDVVRVKTSGTYVNMEGPAFSTKAESFFHRKQGFDVVGMTSLAEAKLCREAEICYQSMAMITDYDCWHETEEAVTVEIIIQHVVANTKLAKLVLSDLILGIPAERTCTCGEALKGAIMTEPDSVPPETRERLEPIIGKYM